MFGKGSGMATILVDCQRRTFTRTITFTGLSSPTDAKYVHNPSKLDLPNFPLNVRKGTYSQTFVANHAQDNYFKDLDFLTLNAYDVLQGNAYTLCEEASPSKTKTLRGSA